MNRIDLAVTGAGRWRWRGLPPPDLLVGAGRATHLPLLLAQRLYGGKSVVLMRPGLPLAWFDLCLIPAHDQPPARANVVTTLGALNPLTAAGEHGADRGLILVGGPSRHFHWDDAAVAQQIATLVQARAGMRWCLTTSRRTPADFVSRLNAPGVEIVPAAHTSPGWLAAQLAAAGEAWVTPDSVSMVYEALTAGCRVGLFTLPAHAASRVARGVQQLLREGRVADDPRRAPPPTPALAEAARCAAIIRARWMP